MDTYDRLQNEIEGVAEIIDEIDLWINNLSNLNDTCEIGEASVAFTINGYNRR